MATISNYNKKYIRERLLEDHIELNEKIHIIHCGVDSKTLDRQHPDIENRGGVYYIVTVGRLVEKKGIKYLIDACANLKRRGINQFKCEIVGDGPLREELEKLIQSRGLQQAVHLMGVINHEDVLVRNDRFCECICASLYRV